MEDMLPSLAALSLKPVISTGRFNAAQRGCLRWDGWRVENEAAGWRSAEPGANLAARQVGLPHANGRGVHRPLGPKREDSGFRLPKQGGNIRAMV